MKVVEELEEVGYVLDVQDGEIVCQYQSSGNPDPATVRPLLDELQEKKGRAIRYLNRANGEGSGDWVSPSAFVQQATNHLEQQGAFVGHSSRYGDVLIVRDEDVTCPDHYSDLPRWTLQEVRRLIEDDPPPDHIRQLMEAKRSLGGMTYEGKETLSDV